MSDLIEFLLARIAEDEEKARKLLVLAQRTSLNLADPKWLGLEMPGWYAWPQVEAITAHVLAECEAKRRIVRHYRDNTAMHENRAERSQRSWGHAAAYWLAACREIATVYADHPDYREEWRP